MSDQTSRPSQLPISKVRVASTREVVAEQLVYCQRRSATIPVEVCQQCRHFRSIRFDTDDPELAAVVCDEAPTPSVCESGLSLPRLSVSDLMKRDVICVRPDLPLDSAALLMLEHQLKILPVVDQRGRVLGTVCEADVQLEIQAGRCESAVVASAMTPGAMTVPEATCVTRAAAVMAFEEVDCLIALSPNGSVVGLLQTRDLLSWLGSADGYLPRIRRCGR